MLALSSAAAAEGPTLQVESSSIRLDDAAGGGDFGALRLQAFDGTATAPAAFSLRAADVRLETDHADPVAPSAATVDVGATTRTQDLQEAHINGTVNRAGHSLVALAQPGTASASVTASCAEVQAAQEDRVVPTRFVNFEREAYEAPTGDALRWRDCGSSVVRIEGDFILTLWEWDAWVTTGQGDSRALASGHSPSEDAPALYPHVTQARQLWFFVQNGTFTISLPPQGEFFLRQASVTTSAATLLGAHGHLQQGDATIPVSGSQVDLKGDLWITMESASGAVRSVVTGQIESVEEDGAPIPLATAARAPGDPLWPLVAFMGLGLAGTAFYKLRPVIAGAWISRHQAPKHRASSWTELRAEGHRALAARCERRGWFRRARHHLTQAILLVPDNPSFLVQRGILHRRRGAYGSALADHREALSWLRIDPTDDEATFNAMEAARAAALGGEDDMAFWWLGVAVSGQPALAVELDGEPDFAGLRADPRYERVRASWNGPHVGV